MSGTAHLVAGVDSSTQSCKVVIRELGTGRIQRAGSAVHPGGTEVNPQAWWQALRAAIAAAGGVADAAAISIAGQQHGMVALDAEGRVIRDALLWNDTRSAGAAEDLIRELGAENFAEGTGSLPVASFTITKVRWLRDREPRNAQRVAAVALPHDWLTWRLRGYGPVGESPLGPVLDELVTDRSDASGTGYFDSVRNQYLWDFVEVALGSRPVLPRVLAASAFAGRTPQGIVVGPGAGDNAAAALGLNLQEGDVALSIGTSGTVFAVSDVPSHDASGAVAGFADASGRYLPIAVTLNAARVLKSIADLLKVDLSTLSDLALTVEPGAGGLVLIPYFEGERTPNRPNAKASLHGMSIASTTPQNIARAAVEGMLCGLAMALEALEANGVDAKCILLIGGGAQSVAVQRIASTIFNQPVGVPVVSEYVADGAARQAAWVLTGERPDWPLQLSATYQPQFRPEVHAQYRSYL